MTVKLHREVEMDRFDKPLMKNDLKVVPKLCNKYLLLSADAYSASSGVCSYSVVDKCISTLNISACIFTSVINKTGRIRIFLSSITHYLELSKGFFLLFKCFSCLFPKREHSKPSGIVIVITWFGFKYKPFQNVILALDELKLQVPHL